MLSITSTVTQDATIRPQSQQATSAMSQTDLFIHSSCYRYGSDRSSLYVGLSILVQQIKREGRCDVFTAVRKLRAQRQAMIQTLVTSNICNIHEYLSHGHNSRRCTSSCIEPSPTTWTSTRTRTRSMSTACPWGQCRRMGQLR